MSIELRGNTVWIQDLKHKKWNRCGVIKVVNGERCYYTRKREVLRIGGRKGSLGVTKTILEYLVKADVLWVVFQLGQGKPFRIFVTSVTKLLTEGTPYSFSNERDITFHLAVEQLEQGMAQRSITSFLAAVK